MRNVLIHSSMTTDNNVELYKDIFGNSYVIPAHSHLEDPIVPFIAIVNDELVDVPMSDEYGEYIYKVGEIVMAHKDIESLRSYLVAQMELDKLNGLLKERA